MPPAVPPHRTAAGGYTERRYTPIELYELLALADLRDQGFSIPQLQTVVDTLRDHFGTRLFEATGGGGAIQVLTDDHDVYARTVEGAVVSLLKSPMQPMLEVGDQRRLREVGRKVRRRGARRAR